VAGFLPQGLLQDLRRLHLVVAVLAVDAAHVLLHLLPQSPALGVPEHQPRRVFVDVKQIQLAPQAPVVAPLGLFEPAQIGLQVFFAGPGGAVDALQHLVAVVAAPVGPGHLHELEVLELAGAGHMRAAAQVFKGALAVQAQGFVARDAGDDLGLVVLALGLEVRHRCVAPEQAALDFFVFGSEFEHFVLDCRQVFGCERAFVGKVVIKTVLDHRADGHLRIGEQFLDRVGQQVGGGVADQLQPLWVFGGDDGQRGVALDPVRGIHQHTIHLAPERGLGQAGTDGSSHVGHRDRAGKWALRTVGEGDIEHEQVQKNETRLGAAPIIFPQNTLGWPGCLWTKQPASSAQLYLHKAKKPTAIASCKLKPPSFPSAKLALG